MKNGELPRQGGHLKNKTGNGAMFQTTTSPENDYDIHACSPTQKHMVSQSILSFHQTQVNFPEPNPQIPADVSRHKHPVVQGRSHGFQEESYLQE